MSKSSTPCRPTSAPAPGTITRESLVGQIFHAAWGVTMKLNSFAVVLKETAKTAILAPLATRKRHKSVGRGYERPFLLDGQLAMENLLALTRIRTPDNATVLIAHLRLHPRFFGAGASSDARHILGNPSPGETFVQVFRVNKDLADDGSTMLPHRTDYCCYRIWDGREKFYDTND